MGHERNIKTLRRQIRNVVQQLLPELVTSEVVGDIEKRLNETMLQRLTLVDERQKDMHNLLLRASVDNEVKKANHGAFEKSANENQVLVSKENFDAAQESLKG